MPLDLPSVAEFKAAIPKMASEDDGDIAANLALAAMFVSESWLEKDIKPAVIYLAAHYILQQKSATATAGSTGGSGSVETYVSSVSFGERKVSYGVANQRSQSSSSSGGQDSDLQRTPYGRIYLTLRKRNTPVGLVIN